MFNWYIDLILRLINRLVLHNNLNVKLFLAISLSTLLFTSQLKLASQTNNSAYHIVKEMIEQNIEIQTLSYTLAKYERIDGDLIEQITASKIKFIPFTVYMKQQLPKDGLEVLFGNEFNNNLYVNPAGFPWFNITLDPMGSRARDDQHHTVYQSGFTYFVDILNNLMTKYGEETYELVERFEDEVHKGKECYSIKFINPHFKYEQYKVLSGEDLNDIAKKFNLSEHMILELNNDIDDYDDIEQGQLIKLPNDYCSEMTILIDQKELYPVLVKVYDDKGLYEKYEYSNVTINPTFDTNDFSQENPDYNF